MAIKVLKPGLATTVQDLGRPGYYHIGIPLSGGMDRFAAARRQHAGRQPRGRRRARRRVPRAGARVHRRRDGRRHRRRTAAESRRRGARDLDVVSRSRTGQTLSFDFLKRGARAYIAVSGGIDVPLVLGSRSTYALGALGGFKGRKLEAGDELPVGDARAPGRPDRRECPDAAPRPGSPAQLRMMPGLYWHRITEAAGKHFFEDTWKVAPEADRIGYRFRGGRALEFVPSGSSPSAPAPTPPTSSTPAIPTARSRCRAAPSRSCCIATRSRAAAIS